MNGLFFSTQVMLVFIMILCFSLMIKAQTPIGVDCIYKEGDKMNCREYCSRYFKSQPQLAWYNITSNQCEPLKICSWYLHYYHYDDNQCYTDITLKQIAPSEYPQTLVQNKIATFYIDNICVNGVPETGMFQDAPCYCYFMWEDSGKVDMNGYPYKCDTVIGPEKWKGYFLKDLILGPNNTVLMYGQYTPQQLQVIYEQLKQKEISQTYEFVYKYEKPLIFLIQKLIPQEGLIRDSQIMWVAVIVGLIYLIFAFSYLREQNQVIKVTKKQLIERIQSVIEDRRTLYERI